MKNAHTEVSVMSLEKLMSQFQNVAETVTALATAIDDIDLSHIPVPAEYPTTPYFTHNECKLCRYHLDSMPDPIYAGLWDFLFNFTEDVVAPTDGSQWIEDQLTRAQQCVCRHTGCANKFALAN